MLDGEREHRECDLRRLAELHVEAIDDSIPSFLGAAYAFHLYRYLAVSDLEEVVTERVCDRIGSGCVLSFAPDSVQSRIARATWAPLLHRGFSAGLQRPDFRAFAAATLREAVRGGTPPLPGPAIVYLFTDAALRGRGLGKRLIERADALVAERGRDSYFVQTIDEPGNRAIGFYEDAGFVRIGSRDERGRCFALFQRKLDEA